MDHIKRQIKAQIVEHLDKKEITVITGARQVGKTTLLHEIKDDLIKKGHHVLFLNLDIDNHSSYFKSQDTLLQKIELEIGKKGYVFIDEIQRLENAGLFMKGIFDRNTPYKFVITGSGSLELKEKIHESLTGRKRLFEMKPVNFVEFVNYKTQYKYENNLSLFFQIEHEKTNAFIIEYLNFGGYPVIITEHTLSGKLLLMNELFKSYIEKDLVYLLKIERPQTFELLVKLLAALTGNLINYTLLASQTNLSVPTLKKYLWFAEKTFCIHYVSPFFTNPLKEITKSPVYYFNDIGMRNYALGYMGNLLMDSQLGFVFQNFVFNTIIDLLFFKNQSVHYWRTTDNAEVNFVIKRQDDVLPVEVKYSEIKNPSVSRSFRSFIEKYSPKEALLVNKNFKSELIINNTKVIFLPVYELFSFFE